MFVCFAEKDSDDETGVGGEDESIPSAQEQARKVYTTNVDNALKPLAPTALSTVLSAAFSLVSPALSAIALTSHSERTGERCVSLANSAPAHYMLRAEGAGIAAECASVGASGSGAGEERQDVNMGASASAAASEGGTGAGAGAGAGKQGGYVTASGRVISDERWRALFGSDSSSSDSDGNDGCIVGDGCGAGGSGVELGVDTAAGESSKKCDELLADTPSSEATKEDGKIV